jgi:hypothetical protein
MTAVAVSLSLEINRMLPARSIASETVLRRHGEWHDKPFPARANRALREGRPGGRRLRKCGCWMSEGSYMTASSTAIGRAAVKQEGRQLFGGEPADRSFGGPRLVRMGSGRREVPA